MATSPAHGLLPLIGSGVRDAGCLLLARALTTYGFVGLVVLDGRTWFLATWHRGTSSGLNSFLFLAPSVRSETHFQCTCGRCGLQSRGSWIGWASATRSSESVMLRRFTSSAPYTGQRTSSVL